MITKQYSHYLPFLAQNYNILLLSDNHYESFDEVSHIFANGIQRNTSDSELNNLNLTLMTNKIDLVIVDATENTDQAKRLIDGIRTYNNRLVILTLIDAIPTQASMHLMKVSDYLLLSPFTTEELKGKLVQLLSVFYTIMSIGRREVNLKSGSSDVTILGDFLDFYQGSSLFIVDELIELNQRLKEGELSKELLGEMGDKTLEISEIFSKHTLLVRVSPIFKELALFLKQLDLSTIPPKGLKGFDYLSDIIDDLNKNMMDIFVDRIFQDVHVFEDSLKNNIQFMESALFTHAEDKSELDFFE